MTCSIWHEMIVIIIQQQAHSWKKPLWVPKAYGESIFFFFFFCTIRNHEDYHATITYTEDYYVISSESNGVELYQMRDCIRSCPLECRVS